MIANRIIAVLLSLALCMGLSGCSYSSSKSKSSSSGLSASSVANVETKKKTYADVATPYPQLYKYYPEKWCMLSYDESKVIPYQDAGSYIGQNVIVEGCPSSVIHASSSSGSPYFFNFGDQQFTAVIWEEDLDKFLIADLDSYVDWSKSAQPINAVFRVSGTVSSYNGRCQIVVRHPSQLAIDFENEWMFKASPETEKEISRIKHS